MGLKKLNMRKNTGGSHVRVPLKGDRGVLDLPVVSRELCNISYKE